MTPALLTEMIRAATSRVLISRGLDLSALPSDLSVERPRSRDHGDYATNVALRTAKKVGVPPRRLAEWLAEELAGLQGIATAEVAGPGFINLRLMVGAQGAIIAQVLAVAEDYGTGDEHSGRTVNLEFASTNPTGPLHLGGARWAAVGDTLGNVLSARGARVTREYYFNDAGAQSDGRPAYLAGDIAYLLDKRSRGFDLCIHLLGADHHGHVARLKAAAAAFGDDPAVVEVLIGQSVCLVKDGRPVRMSRRAGDVVTMDDLVAAVGVDAARYSLIRSPVDSALDVDIGLLVKRSNENPVFSVQYAHARLASLVRNAAECGVVIGTAYELLDHPREGALIRTIGEFPDVVRKAAELREPHRVARYAESLANAYHRFYDTCRVLPVGDEAITDLHRARLALCAATRRVLSNALALLGISAPIRM